MNEAPRVMLVDDEEGFVVALGRALRAGGCETHVYTSPEEALAALPPLELDVLLSDVRMPGMSGLDLLAAVRRQKPDVEVVLLTAFATVETAVAALKQGAYDYLTKPVEDIGEVLRLVERAAERKRLLSRNRFLEQKLHGFEGLVGQAPAMREVYRLIDAVAQTDSSVVLEGETGTGKELAARAIHDRSARRAKRFVAVNCGALPEPILESELFGHVKGAFTGAVAAKRGLFEAASGGTLFLDEIGDMPPAMQVKLLRALQEGEVRPVGGSESVKVDVRTIAATHRSLEQEVRDGAFRADLYYRVNVVRIPLPPLRERVEDIPILAWHFLRKHAERSGKDVKSMSPQVLEALSVAPWPGNVRELENTIERAVVLTRGETLELQDLPLPLQGGVSRATGSDALAALPYARARVVAMRAFERRYLEELLARHEGNISSAARAAGMDRSNFRRILRKHRLATDDA